MKWIKAAGTYYHVTYTDKVDKIKQEGIRPLQTSNWLQQGTGERYGDGKIYAMDNRIDAIRWAAKMEWEFFQTMGDEKISIIEFNDTEDWEIDNSDPLSQLGNEGNWLQRDGALKPENIIGSFPATNKEVQEVTARN